MVGEVITVQLRRRKAFDLKNEKKKEMEYSAVMKAGNFTHGITCEKKKNCRGSLEN